MQAATYTDQNGRVFPHISTTGLTEADITLMETIEHALCRYARVTPFHPAEAARVSDVIVEALIVLDEFGPEALEWATIPADADEVQANTWRHVRRVAGAKVRRTRSNRPLFPLVYRKPRVWAMPPDVALVAA